MDPTKTRASTDVPSLVPGPGAPRIVMLQGPDIGRQLELGSDPIYIGRGEDATLRVDSDLISRMHACIMRFGARYVLKDLESTNGTFVNGDRMEGTRTLSEGDQIRIGKVVLRYTEDVVEAAYHEQVVERARVDGLTRAYNKAHFDSAFRAQLKGARAAGEPFSLIVFDIDHFKRINDTFGHLVGDRVLSQMADIVRATVPESALFARVGGEEFAVVLEGPIEQARALAERIRHAVEATRFSAEGAVVPVTLSLGCAAPTSEESAEELYAEADRRLYEAKHGGRNQVR